MIFLFLLLSIKKFYSIGAVELDYSTHYEIINLSKVDTSGYIVYILRLTIVGNDG